ncbi:MAG TPA: hypothetical protein VFQ38_03175 [Longimicrobiales bacterium]|nr:hypothetical protein [Longimicrobiales bacterium]
MTEVELGLLIQESAATLAKQVLEDWREVGRKEKWLALPESITYDSLPEVLQAIAAVALVTPFTAAACRTLVGFAAEHGETRQREGFPESLIYTEYQLLRRSLWEFVHDRIEPEAAVDAIMRVDAVLSLGTLASLRGFHRPTYEARNAWPRTLDELAKEWPLFGTGDA